MLLFPTAVLCTTWSYHCTPWTYHKCQCTYKPLGSLVLLLLGAASAYRVLQLKPVVASATGSLYPQVDATAPAGDPPATAVTLYMLVGVARRGRACPLADTGTAYDMGTCYRQVGAASSCSGSHVDVIVATRSNSVVGRVTRALGRQERGITVTGVSWSPDG